MSQWDADVFSKRCEQLKQEVSQYRAKIENLFSDTYNNDMKKLTELAQDLIQLESEKINNQNLLAKLKTNILLHKNAHIFIGSVEQNTDSSIIMNVTGENAVHKVQSDEIPVAHVVNNNNSSETVITATATLMDIVQ